MKTFNSKNIKQWADNLYAGDEILLSGTIYSARDAAHKKIKALIQNGEKIPFDIQGAIIYYVGPTPAKGNLPIGSCGPTTSSRMDIYTPQLLDLGLGGMIGKGQRSNDVINAIIRNNSIYLCAIGGAGALAAKCVKKLDIIAFQELGCESVKCIEICDFPLIVGIDSHGGNLFSRCMQ